MPNSTTITANGYTIHSPITPALCTKTFTSCSSSHLRLQKSDGNYVEVDDIITKKDITSTSFLWESLFLAICQENPLKAPEYMTALKLYNDDYKKAVIAIETAAIPE